jgi:hypothetical protein
VRLKESKDLIWKSCTRLIYVQSRTLWFLHPTNFAAACEMKHTKRVLQAVSVARVDRSLEQDFKPFPFDIATRVSMVT